MGWLFGQLWFWLLVAFLVGSLLTFLVISSVLPTVEEVEAETGLKTRKVL